MVKSGGGAHTLVNLKDDLLFLTCYLLTIEVTNVKIATMHALEARGPLPGCLAQKVAMTRPNGSLNEDNLKLHFNARSQPVAN